MAGKIFIFVATFARFNSVLIWLPLCDTKKIFKIVKKYILKDLTSMIF